MLRTAVFFAALAGYSPSACNDATTADDRPVPAPCTPLADPSTTIALEGVTGDGNYVVVLGVTGATSRVFYGTRAHMVEGRITGMSAGCAQYYDFIVEGRSYGAVFAAPMCGPDDASRLVAGEAGGPMVTHPLEVLVGVPRGDAGPDAGTPAPAPSAFSFYCS